MKNGFETIGVSNEGRWLEELERIGSYDSYHLPQYHRLAEIRGEGEAVLLVCHHRGGTIAMPMLVRDIDLPFSSQAGSSLRDATSVYGYAGPVASASVGEETVSAFSGVLQEYLVAERVVCAFARLHPLIDASSRCLGGCGRILPVGPTISMDLTEPPATQRSRMSATFRKNINRLRRMEFVAEEAGRECLEDHVRIYRDTMDRNEASEYYLFDRAYFEFLMDEMAGNARLFACRHEGVIVSTVLAMHCCGILQGHLGGTAREYMALSPMKLIFDEMRIWGNAHGAHTLHVGGGVGARRDALLGFKKAFSPREHIFSVWQHVVEPGVYAELCDLWCAWAGEEPSTAYFPLYRHPLLPPIQASQEFCGNE
ncbi:MAG: GNAT family N-acetyltransferase [Armatimonadetes bacterium]|nr:GNAT family N-acetyltransferase [Armatimonadota bacterium]